MLKTFNKEKKKLLKSGFVLSNQLTIWLWLQKTRWYSLKLEPCAFIQLGVAQKN